MLRPSRLRMLFLTAAAAYLCQLRLIITLTPDIPHPRDDGFLSSLVGHHPAYALTWLKKAEPFGVVVNLSGPGPKARCREVVASMRKDGRVLSIREEAGSQEQSE
jgi:hypothetical protein